MAKHSKQEFPPFVPYGGKPSWEATATELAGEVERLRVEVYNLRVALEDCAAWLCDCIPHTAGWELGQAAKRALSNKAKAKGE